MGEQFTAADVVIGSNIRWGTIFKLIPERKVFLDYAAAGGAPGGEKGRGEGQGDGASVSLQRSCRMG